MKTTNTHTMNSLETKLANALTERRFSFTIAQVQFIANSTHDLLPKGKTFNQAMSGSMYMTEMVSNFIDFSNLSKWESDFNNL
tara:strand:- start:789 stop:1037 length:249 start_codon:yes stop_codon:yes gene_type:complete